MNAGERKFMDYVTRRTGRFYSHLFAAMISADTENSVKLSKGFPEEVEAVRYWKENPGYAEQLNKEYSRHDESRSGAVQTDAEKTATERRNNLRAIHSDEEESETENVSDTEG